MVEGERVIEGIKILPALRKISTGQDLEVAVKDLFLAKTTALLLGVNVFDQAVRRQGFMARADK